MTLQESFNIWSAAPRNMALANKSRTAVNTVLMKHYADTDLSAIDEDFARNIFATSDAAQELKTKAASILVYLLQWGGDHGHCERPMFDRTVACEVIPPELICQLDPATLKVVKTWRNAFRILEEIGVGNIARAIERCGMAGGFYWTYARDLATFRERLEQKKRHNLAVKQEAVKKMCAARAAARGTASPDESPLPDFDSAQGTPAPEPQPAEVITDVPEPEAPAPEPETPEAPAPEEQRPSVAQQALAVFTDQELFDELDRRGWHGCFSKTEVITIGN